LKQISDYFLVSDQILIDAKPPKSADLPGGNGLSFDWRLLVGRHWLKPWILAGGLTAENVAQAVALTKAKQVDVSSGIESSVGLKDPTQMQAFATALTTS
jgi:phosphoribosylanthranilate isomerase